MTPKNLYFSLVGLLSLLAVGILTAFWVGHQRIDQKINKLDKINTDLVIENQQIDRLQQLEIEFNRIRPLAEKVSSVLPDQKQQDQVVAQVAAIVNKSGLSLGGLTFEKTAGLPSERSQTQASKIGGILVMPVRFQTTGSYKQLQQMLANFEKEERYMRVSTLDLSRNGEGRITAGVLLEVFFKP